MHSLHAKVSELFEVGGSAAALVDLDRPVLPLPGQYFKATAYHAGTILPVTVFPLDAGGNRLSLLPETAQIWYVGEELNLRGPLGNGFRLPTAAEWIGLVNYERCNAACLLPLANVLLAAGKEVTLVTDAPVQGLPLAVEVLPGDQAEEVAAWADALAIWAGQQDIPVLWQDFGKESSRKSIEVFIQSNMPCAGLAACGVCAVLTKKGWKHACKDGPVFVLHELVEE